MSSRTAFLLFLVLIAGCADPQSLPRSRWEAMNGHDKVLFVRSMLGREHVLQRKGRQTSETWSRGAAWYSSEIDRRYAGGDTRPVGQIWNDLSDGRLAAATQQTDRLTGAKSSAGGGRVP